MKEYMRLSVDAEAYHSGSTYTEEVFVPLDVWESIKDNVQMFIYIGGLDGKHSEVKADIEADTWNEEQLAGYRAFTSNDGERLYDHICEYLNYDTYDDEDFLVTQKEVENYCQFETLTIKINKKQKEEVMQVLEKYLI